MKNVAKIFDEAKKSKFGYEKIADQMQGDDSLFLLLCRKYENINVKFVTAKESFVVSRPELTWNTLLTQRIRWAGDSKIFWKFNIPFFTTSLSTLLFNMSIITLPIIYFFSKSNYIVFISIICLKLIAELFLLLKASKVFSRNFLIIEFFEWFIIQPIYVLTVSLATLLNINPKWKNRYL